MNKYRLRTDLTKVWGDKTLRAIQALTDFGDVKKGDIGGYVESAYNLSQEGTSWIYGDAVVFGDARVLHDAKVYDNAVVSGNACIFGSARVYDEAMVYGGAEVYGNARVSGNAIVSGKAEVSGEAKVSGKAEVYGNARVSGNAIVSGKAEVCSDEDFYVSKNIWSSGRYFTYTRSNRMWKVGCFFGTGDELIAKAYKDSEVSGREYKRIVEYVEAMYAALDKDKEQSGTNL